MKGSELIFLASLLSALSLCQELNNQTKNPSTTLDNTNSPNATVDNGTIFPQEILDNYAEYVSLENYVEVCSLEKLIETYDEATSLKKIKEKKCIPNQKTFVMILDYGWSQLAEYLIKEVYLPHNIDPSHTVYTYIYKNEQKVKTLQTLIEKEKKFENFLPVYKFENFDNQVKFSILLPDAGFIPEYISIFCYKDLFRINAIFKTRGHVYRLTDHKKFFDVVENDCENSFNSFNNQIEVVLNKKSKLKTWEKLFK